MEKDKSETIQSALGNVGSIHNRKINRQNRENISSLEILDSSFEADNIEALLKEIFELLKQIKYEVDFIKAIYTKPISSTSKKKNTREQEMLALKHKILTRGKSIG